MRPFPARERETGALRLLARQHPLPFLTGRWQQSCARGLTSSCSELVPVAP